LQSIFTIKAIRGVFDFFRGQAFFATVAMGLTFGIPAVKTAVDVVGLGPIGWRVGVDLEHVARRTERYRIFFEVLFPSFSKRVDLWSCFFFFFFLFFLCHLPQLGKRAKRKVAPSEFIRHRKMPFA